MIRTILYWLFTAIVALAYAGGAFYDISQPDQVKEGAVKLGYPLYFFTILGVWKAFAVVALLAPALPRLKEWAYAGIFFNLTGAAATHMFMHDPVDDIMPPLVILVFVAVSYFTRPASRKLAGPIL